MDMFEAKHFHDLIYDFRSLLPPPFPPTLPLPLKYILRPVSAHVGKIKSHESASERELHICQIFISNQFKVCSDHKLSFLSKLKANINLQEQVRFYSLYCSTVHRI